MNKMDVGRIPKIYSITNQRETDSGGDPGISSEIVRKLT